MTARETSTRLVAIGVVSLAVLSVSCRQQLTARYHLDKLNNSSEYFRQILEHPEGTPEREAIRVFLRGREGKEALFREYADVLKANLFSSDRGFDAAGTVIDGLFWAGEKRSSYIQWGVPTTIGSYGHPVSVESDGRWRVTRELLGELDNSEFEIPDYPELRFTIAVADRVFDESTALGLDSFIRPDSGTVGCRITRNSESAASLVTPLLDFPNSTTRRHAAIILGSLGPAAKRSIPALKALLKQRRFQRQPNGSLDYRAQKAAEDALAKIGT